MVQWKTVFPLLSENRLNDKQFGIFVDMLHTLTQKLVLLHAGGGTGKTVATCKIFVELASRNEICNCTCLTGVGASHLPQGQTFHSVFRTWTPSLSAGTAIDDMFKSLGGNQPKIVMVDEVSMLSMQFLVLLDTRLRSMYNSDQTFGRGSSPENDIFQRSQKSFLSVLIHSTKCKHDLSLGFSQKF